MTGRVHSVNIAVMYVRFSLTALMRHERCVRPTKIKNVHSQTPVGYSTDAFGPYAPG